MTAAHFQPPRKKRKEKKEEEGGKKKSLLGRVWLLRPLSVSWFALCTRPPDAAAQIKTHRPPLIQALIRTLFYFITKLPLNYYVITHKWKMVESC